jgi:hypothetical protein
MRHKQNGLVSAPTDQALTSNQTTGKQASDSVPGQMLFAIMSHDDDCPTLKTQSSLDCNCSPEVRLVTEAEFFESIGGAK